MSPDFSNIIKLLKRKGGRALHRHVFILAGDNSWQKEVLQEILSGYEGDSLWLGEDAPEAFPAVETRQAQSWLGKEKRVVVFDANNSFDADSFAAISGIVVGGGLFILLFPPAEKWNDVYQSYFGQRLINSISHTPELIVINHNDTEFTFTPDKSKTNFSPDCEAPFLTLDQQSAVECIEEESLAEVNRPIVLVSDRGRGKSAALGIAAARLIHAGIKNIVITAPRLRASDIVFKHLAEILPNAMVTRGKVIHGKSVVQFYSPDQLIDEDINADLLLIDEAAAIPVPLLISFLHKFSQCVFATTVHGYEGTGRGFAIRFYKILNENNPGWIKLQMQSPIRWATNDPLEKWMFDLLHLGAETPGLNLNNIDENKIAISCLSQFELSQDDKLLSDVFSLLVLAHYRTQPGDLVRILDDEKFTVYTVKYAQQITAVALINHEGEFSTSLATQVYRGERRPPGHLLAQTLSYHCGVEHAACLKYARIMRIVVHPELQNKGIGTKLLDFINENEKKQGHDIIGTSFGMTKSLLNFWQQSGFDVVRIGFKREQTSGEHAAVMTVGLTDKGNDVYQEASTRFKAQLCFWFVDALKDLPGEIKNFFPQEEGGLSELTALDKKDLQSFINNSRNYELCIAAINKFVLLNLDKIKQAGFPQEFRNILNEKVINKLSWKEICRVMHLSGQSDARKVFKQAFEYLAD